MMLWKSTAVIVVLFLCGCTPRHAVVTPDLHTQMMADLKAGKPNLTCNLECVFSWTSNFRRMITLHSASQWEALVDDAGRELSVLDVRFGGKTVCEGKSIIVDLAPRSLGKTPSSGCQTAVAETC